MAADTYIPTEAEKRLSTWVNAAIALENFTFPVTTVFAAQQGQRPPNEVVQILITSDRRIQGADREVLGDSGDELASGKFAYRVIEHRSGVVQIRTFGLQHLTVAGAIEASLDDPVIEELFNSQCLWVSNPVSDRNSVPSSLSTRTQLSSVQDFKFNYARERVRDQAGGGVDVIERVIATGTVDGMTAVSDTEEQ